MTFDQFMSKYNALKVDVDGYYGGQCWDLVALYNEQVIGVPASQGYGLPTGPDGAAREVYQDFQDPLPQYFDRLDTSHPPQKGDVVVWGAGPGDSAGHIAIFISGDLNNFNSFDQNWPLNSPAHVQNHNSNYVIGFLRPKTQEEEVIEDKNHLDALFLAFRNRYPNQSEYDAYVGKMPYHAMVEALNAGPERDDVSHELQIGTLAVKDNWEQQINDGLAKIKDQQDQINQLKAQTANSSDANILGQALIAVLAKLGYKKG